MKGFVDWWFSLRLGRFLTVGASGTVVNWLLFTGLYVFGVVHWLAIAVGVESSILWNFFWHNKWTFYDRQKQSLSSRLTKYHYTALGGVMITYVVFYLLFLWAEWSAPIAYIPAILSATGVNYLLSNRWAWRH